MTTRAGPTTSTFINRELSWLEFNQRVLEEARDPSNPLLERLKFFCITNSNLDEFFEVRVAGLRQQCAGGVNERGPDGRLPVEALRMVRERIRRQVGEMTECWQSELVRELEGHGIRFRRVEDLDASELAWVDGFYRERVHPVLTPLAIDQSHPFPLLLNKMINVVVKLVDPAEAEGEPKMAVIQVPPNLPRLVRLPRQDGRHDYVFLGRIIGHFLDRLFVGMRMLGNWSIRVTRNGELYVDREDAANILRAVEQELHNRLKGEAVRLEVSQDTPEDVCRVLMEQLELTEEDLYRIDYPLHPGRIIGIAEGIQRPELRDAPFVAPVPKVLEGAKSDYFGAIRERDILVHHPFESFNPVIEFLRRAAGDPQVLAIKQTLYRTGGDTGIIDALIGAARNGKQVTAIVELQARFDEQNNIEWARKLENAGVHVVYGLVGYKIHAKVALVVRAEEGGIRRYVHLSTGNYNATTARLYTDLGLFTARPDFGEDATALFNLLTGICQFQPMRRFLVAPFELHGRMLALIRQEIANAKRGIPARIIAKMNSLVDPEIIETLYEASAAGVEIDLIVRGICCLRPGVAGVSERIRVRSIVDRFLEHSRVYYFENGANPRVYLGSADWMPRNFFRRIEVVFPVEDGVLRDRLVHEVLAMNLADNVRARFLQSDDRYVRATPSASSPPVRSQFRLLEAAARAARAEDLTGASGGAAGEAGAGSKRRYPKVTVRERPEGV